MGIINNILEPISEYFLSLDNDIESEFGGFKLKIGIHKSWVFRENENISCIVLQETDNGKIIEISQKNDKIDVDDLFLFVKKIIDTNGSILEREMKFAKEVEEIKSNIEKKANSFYKELELLKENSFNDLTKDVDNDVIKKQKKPIKPVKPVPKTSQVKKKVKPVSSVKDNAETNMDVVINDKE